MEKELQDKLDIGYKRLAMVSSLWASIGMPFVFLVDNSHITIAVFIWMIWANIGVFISPKIIRLLWKN